MPDTPVTVSMLDSAMRVVTDASEKIHRDNIDRFDRLSETVGTIRDALVGDEMSGVPGVLGEHRILWKEREAQKLHDAKVMAQHELLWAEREEREQKLRGMKRVVWACVLAVVAAWGERLASRFWPVPIPITQPAHP